ncbi:MAG TPA: LuxR C-terminal-related transcriptional regulator [Arthrobacter sp.]|jgi:DNA-binding CsgD family transcriptional regulator|nr:LuxR C-terminal-related transcriptional regulator [Arthrobacter sp.]
MESLAEGARLMERAALVKEVVRGLRDDTRSGALVVGSAGLGKTSVAKAAIRELRPPGPLIRLSATRALAAVPFGALAPYLAKLPARDLDSYAAVLEDITGSLKSEAVRPLFVIDDAQCLDRGTIQVLARAVATGAASILATSLPGAMIPEEFLALWDDGILSKFDLAPLSRPGTHQLCEQALRADVSPWVSGLFHDVAEGNPLMLLSLIEHSRATGALGCRRGVWFLLSNPDLAEVTAADVVDQQLRSMTPEEKTAATIVALAGPLSLGQFLRFSAPRTVDALDLAGIISVSHGHERIVRPVSPIVGEIIRRRVPAGRSAELRASVLELAATGTVLPDASLNRLRWSLDCGAQLPPGQLLQAAVSSNAALDAAAASRAAGAVQDERFLPEARIQLAYSNFILGRPVEAAGCLLSAQPLHYGRSSYLAALLSARLGGPAPAQELRSETAPAAARNAGPAQDEPLWTQSSAAGLAGDILNHSWDGRFLDVGARLRELIRVAKANPEIRVPAVSHLAELLTAQGRLLTGLCLGREAWRGARSASLALPLVYEDLVTHHALILIRAGAWDELGEVLDDYAARHPARLLYSGGMLHILRGFSRLRQGRMHESLSELLLGVEELRIADPLNLLPFAHSVAAYAAAAVGRQREAQEHSRAYRISVYREPKTLRLLAEAYCRVAEFADEQDGGGRKSLGELADEAQRQGLRTVETDIRRLAVRNGDTGGAQALAASSRAVEGPEARLLESFAHALSASDASELIAISDEALGARHPLLALEAAQQAELLLEHIPDRWRLSAVQRRLHHRMVEVGIFPRAELARSSSNTGLTAREAEILELVSEGGTNAGIAAELCVSQRTVEGHLSRIFAKLGVSRRVELLQRKTARS